MDQVAKVATDLNIRPQKIYKWIKEGKIKGEKIDRKTCVDPVAVKEVLEEELKHPRTAKSGHHLNWQALTDLLKNSNSGEEDRNNRIHLEIDSIRKMVGAPNSRLEMLHYWDPYRTQTKFSNQGSGLKAIRAASWQ